MGSGGENDQVISESAVSEHVLRVCAWPFSGNVSFPLLGITQVHSQSVERADGPERGQITLPEAS